MELLPTPPTKVPFELIVIGERQRKIYPNIDDLAASLRDIGLIQPIVLDQDYNLIAGGRRLAAAKMLGWTEIPAVFRETLTEDEKLVLELEENLQRENITWQEACLATARIHRLKKRLSGLASQSWGERETGRLLNMSAGNVNYTLRVARALEAEHPKVLAAENMTEAIRVLIQEKEDELVLSLATPTATTLISVEALPAVQSNDPLGLGQPVQFGGGSPTSSTPRQPTRACLANFALADCLNLLAGRFDPNFPTIDAFITDPPYAIDVAMMDQASGGVANIDRIVDTHDSKENLTLFAKVIPLMVPILKPNGFIAMWCDIMRWMDLYNLLSAAGLSVQRWPVVWHKTSPCINQMAYKNFTKNVEFVIVARKGNAIMAKPGASCVISAPNTQKLSGHPFTKPRDVWKFLTDHLVPPGGLIVDPFMGVGSGVLSFLEDGFRVIGCEIDPIHHAHAQENIRSWYLSKDPDTIFL